MLRIWCRVIALGSLLIGSFLLPSYPVVANVTVLEQRDFELEAELDALLGPGMYPADRQGFAQLLIDITPTTPVSTYVRAWGYRALELAHAEKAYDAAEEIARKLLEHAERGNSVAAIAEVYALKAEIFDLQNKRQLAQRAVADFERHSHDVTNPRILFFGHNVAGRVLANAQQHEQALEHFLRAQQAIVNDDQQQNVRRRQFLNMHIARLYATIENFEAALPIVRSAIDEGLRYQVHHRLPDLYLVQGYVLGHLTSRSDAIQSYRHALYWAEQEKDVRIQIIARNNMASELINDADFDAAEELLLEARTVAYSEQRLRELQFVEFNLANIDVKRGNYAAGIDRMLAIREAIVSHGNGRDEAEVLYYLALAYGEAGLFEEQAKTLLDLHDVRQRLFRSDREQLMVEMQARYEAHDQAQQIALLQHENQLREQQLQNTQLVRGISVLLILVLVLVLIVIAMGYRTSRKANQQLNEANRRLHQQALLDPLTGLGNRRHFQNLMQARRQQAHPASSVLMLLDLDHFKQINDTLGHAAGDEVLRDVAKRLISVCGEDAHIIRWGGEEFLIYAPCAAAAEATVLTENILIALNEAPVVYNTGEIAVHATIGTVMLPISDIDETQLDWEKALQLADNLLYVGKLEGRNQAHCLKSIRGPYQTIESLLFRDFNAALELDVLDVVKIQIEVSEPG